MKITGLDRLTRQLKEAQQAFADVDGELGTVRFDPSSPGSIEAAIRQMEALVDARLGEYGSNPIVAPMAEELKAKYRDAIIAKAAGARLKADAS